ncbi:MAG: hypothetical protein JW769_00100 [Parachlamydiales bacterium]|nr:hypothetical protein [Parachlamydiales bacterium]
MMKDSLALREQIFYGLKKWTQGYFYEDREKLFKDFADKDKRLGMEITYGVIRNFFSLQFLSLQLAPKIRLNGLEKLLLYMAVYQYLYLESIPLYAIVNDTVALFKKFFRKEKASFVNAVLRKIKDIPFFLPATNRIKDLSQRFSYPEYFVGTLIQQYGLQKAKEMLQQQNLPVPLMMRLRDSALWKDFPVVYSRRSRVVLCDVSMIAKISSDPRLYIQNVTPVVLMEELRGMSSMQDPQTILDLCAAPGGKLLLAHDFFPLAALFANDISKERMAVLQQNMNKYHLHVDVRIGPAESYPSQRSFDRIIIDAPCSNSGVLYKRAEARWRIAKESVGNLAHQQLAILRRAKDLLSESGEIWYLTCSILQQENEGLVEQAKSLGLIFIGHKTILPDHRGYEGGFCCSFMKN